MSNVTKYCALSDTFNDSFIDYFIEHRSKYIAQNTNNDSASIFTDHNNVALNVNDNCDEASPTSLGSGNFTMQYVKENVPQGNLKNVIVDPLILTLEERRKKNPNNLILGHVNVNSLKLKFDYFAILLRKGLLDVLCITETKLDETYSNVVYSCDNYRCHREDKSSTSGGMMILVRSDIPHTRVKDYEIVETSCHIENIVLHFRLKKSKFYLSCIYKNPKVPDEIFVSLLDKSYGQMCSSGAESVLLGDLNINMLNKNNVIQNYICDVYGLKNIIKSPTCNKSQNGSLIDPVLVSNTSKFCSSFNVVCGESDWHNMVGCVIKVSVPKIKPFKITYRSYKDFNDNKFKEAVSQILDIVCNVFDEIDDQYWAFSTMFMNVLNDHAPIKSRTVKGSKVPYMHAKLMNEIYKRNQLKNIYFQNRSACNWENFRCQRNKVTHMRKIAIRNYFTKKCDSKRASPKVFWSTVKPFLSQKCSSNSGTITLKESDDVISCQEKVSNVLNDYFVSIADGIGFPILSSDVELSKIISMYSDHSSIKSIEKNVLLIGKSVFNFKPVTSEQMYEKLKKIDGSKSTGFDLIDPKCVKMCAKELSIPLTSIVNNALKENAFPHDMKKAEVAPIHKKKDHLCKENYRPINVIIVLAKVIESIIAEQIQDYMSSYFNKLLGAYRKGYGCNQMLMYAIDMWKKSLDNNEVVGTLLMDLSKAFDSVPHDLLLCKLNAYGFSSNACSFIKSYLSHRQQRVKIQSHRSEWKITTRGIPQGSCLGPLLFNIYLNDIFGSVKDTHLFNYADDNTLSTSNVNVSNVVSTLISEAENCVNWFNKNCMQVNAEKFQVMFLKPFRKHIDLPMKLTVNECSIDVSNCVKLLGINIDANLNFDKHVNELCRKASRQLSVLTRFKSVFGKKEKMLMYNTFILSCFNFCPVVWHFCGKMLTRKIEKNTGKSSKISDE